MATRNVRIDGLGDPKLEQKVAQIRLAQTRPSIVMAPTQAVMEPPRVVPRLRRMPTPLTREDIEAAVEAQARKGTMGGLPLKLSTSKKAGPFRTVEGAEQGFFYEPESGIFGPGILKERRLVGNDWRSRFESPFKAAEGMSPLPFVHTHPGWAKPGPGPEDFGHDRSIFGVHPRGVWVLHPGENLERRVRPRRP